MPALAIWTPEDGLLGMVAPLGLAVAGGRCLMIDLDPLGPAYPGSRSLAELVADEPRREDLTPGRSGIALLRNGGVDPGQAVDVVDALLRAWDRVVLRLPPRNPPAVSVPVVPVRLMLPGGMLPPLDRPAAYQATPAGFRPPGPGIRLPIPRPATIGALLRGRMPSRRDRWIGAWRRAWEVSWER